MTDIVSLAQQVLRCLDDHQQMALVSTAYPEMTLADAYAVTRLLREAFEARGEKIVGRKIGFTNRDMWRVYGVRAPIWGYCTGRTTHSLRPDGVVRCADFVEPRIEPEIVFGLRAAPVAGMNARALLDCVEWLALGFELVQSIFADWKFAGIDTVCANALHGALLIGSRYTIAPRTELWERELATFQLELACNGTLVQRGGGELVLGTPLSALKHLVDGLASDRSQPPLAAGDIVSTGTLTLAMPVRAGQTWTAKARGIPLEPIALRFA